jgi:tetratricopeptide (TPR) repeat protein
VKRNRADKQRDRERQRREAAPVKAAASEPALPLDSRPPGVERLIAAVAFAAVLAVVAFAHWPVLSAQAIIFDDGMYLFENPVLMRPSWSSAWTVLSEVFHSSTVEGYYEPLTLHSLMLDVAQGGARDNLLPFHRTSLILHLANTLLVMVLLASLTGQPRLAALVGLLFGVHPLTVEPLAWVWERKTLLATLFVLVSLIAYVRYARAAESGKRGRVTYVVALVAFLLALMSKPTVTPLPVMIVLLDAWPLRRRLRDRRVILEKAPFFALALLFGVVTIISTANTGQVTVQAGGGGVIRAIYLFGFYLLKIAWPVRLTSAYEMPQPMSLANVAVLANVLLALGVVVAVIVAVRRTRGGAVAIGWLLVGLMPTMGIVNYSWVAASDKYVYFPIVGVLIGLTFLLGSLWNSIRRRSNARLAWTIVIVACLVATLFEVRLTRRYLARWRDTITISRHMLSITPDASSALILLGDEYGRRGRTDEATRTFEHALRVDPHNAAANLAVCSLLAKSGRVDEAAARLETAQLRGTEQSQAAAHLLMGKFRLQQNRADDAIRYLLEALRLQPHNREAQLDLGLAYYEANRPDDAAACFQRVLGDALRDEEAVAAQFHLGMIALNARRLQDAVRHFEAVLAIDRVEPRAHFQLGLLAQSVGQVDRAVLHYRAALERNPASTARNNLARILATSRDDARRNGAEAVKLLEAAPPATKERADFLDTLAAAYAEAGDFSRAVATARDAADRAVKARDAKLEQQIRERIALYEKGIAYRE